jgi:hypothetical protein
MPQPYQERVVTERADLATKTSALETFLTTDVARSLPVEERLLLIDQLVAMQKYLSILDSRIEYFTSNEAV